MLLGGRGSAARYRDIVFRAAQSSAKVVNL